MKPTAKAAGGTATASVPSKVGTGRYTDGGATAPMQNAEQALQDECDCFPASEAGE
jgi:hypothetical protein